MRLSRAWACHASDVIPFEEALEPVARRCGFRLRASVGASAEPFTESAFSGLARDLVRRLSHLSGRILFEDFATVRGREGPPRREGLPRRAGSEDASGRRIYEGYVEELLAGRWTKLLRGHPELNRLVDVTTAHWEEASAELMRRLSSDKPLIQAALGTVVPIGRVAGVTPGLSDQHRGGRTVCRLTFESGHRVIYKPRAVGIEASFAALVAWLNDRGLDPPLRAARVLDRGDYGWTECIPATACADDAAARRFYRRAGSLACLLDVLGGIDMHYGNVIACGEDPVLVDLETLFHPSGPGDPEGGRGDEAGDSILRTGFLPSWSPAPDERAYDVSGLGAAAPRPTRIPHLEWRRPNTDAMDLEEGTLHLPRLANAPRLPGTSLSPADFATAIVEGFASTHRFLAANAADLQAGSGPLRSMAERRTRVLLRHTLTYRRMMDETHDPRRLRDGVARKAALERLVSTPTPGPREQARLHELRAAAELDALWRLDIPHFTTRPDACFLETADGLRIEGWFDESRFESAVDRLARLDDDDLDRKSRLLATTLDLLRLQHLMDDA